MTVPRPMGFERWLSDYGPVVFDDETDEPVGWGFEIEEKIPEERFESLRLVYHVEFLPPRVVVLWLGYKGAIEKYGPAGPIERGPRAGFHSITFGGRKFTHPSLALEFQKTVDRMAEIEKERRSY